MSQGWQRNAARRTPACSAFLIGTTEWDAFVDRKTTLLRHFDDRHEPSQVLASKRWNSADSAKPEVLPWSAKATPFGLFHVSKNQVFAIVRINVAAAVLIATAEQTPAWNAVNSTHSWRN